MALPAGRYGVTKNQLLKIKKLPMNTIKLIEELTEKFDLLGTAAFKNSTSVVTSSSDLVESEAVKDIVGWGNKNLLPITLKNIQSGNTSGTWIGNTYVKNGITFTINTDNNGNVVDIVANGTAVGQVGTELNLCQNNTYYLPAGSYILSGGVSYNARIFYYDGTSYYNSRPDEVIFDVSGNENETRYTIVVVTGTTVNNAVFKPMIRKATETDPTFEPYHESVSDSLAQKADNTVIAPVENGSTASQAYAVGEHFIRDGAFCTCKQAISSGGRLTEGTNYTSGKVGDIVYLSGSKSIAVAANSVAWTDFDDLVPFSDYDILGFSFRGNGGYIAMAGFTWVNATDHPFRVVARNFDTEESRSWTIEGFIIVRVK